MSKSPGLLKNTLKVGGLTGISRVLGLVREVVFATTFGATGTMDAFLVAFKIPNFLRRLFAEGAFSQAFVPILSDVKHHNTHTNMRRFIAHVTGTLGWIVLLVAIIGMLTSHWWIRLFAPGFINHPEKFTLTSNLLRITFPYIFLITLTALCGGILNTYNRFGPPAITPVILNISLITASVLGQRFLTVPIQALAWGLTIAGTLQLLFQIHFIMQLKLLSRPRWGWHDSNVKRVIKLMVPALFGASVAQISLMLDTIFASFLKSGSVSWLYYADRLMQFPLGVFGIALSTVVLPTFSKHHVQSNEEKLAQDIDWAMRMIIFISIPAATALAVFATPLLTTLFQYGNFTAFDIQMTTQSLIAYASGLIWFIAVKTLVSIFYAKQDTKTPVKVAVVAMLLNLILNAALVGPLAHAGLALATSLAAFFNAAILLCILIKRRIYRPSAQTLRFLAASLIAAALMGSYLFYAGGSLTAWLDYSLWKRVGELLLMIFIAKSIYFLCLSPWLKQALTPPTH